MSSINQVSGKYFVFWCMFFGKLGFEAQYLEESVETMIQWFFNTEID